MASANVIAKAAHLVEAGRVRRLSTAIVYEVDGEHGRYTVTLCGGEFSCTCPSSGECSHVLAGGVLRDREITGLVETGFEDMARTIFGDAAVDASERAQLEAAGFDFERVHGRPPITDRERASGEAAFARL